MTKAKGTMFETHFRRRREGRTDYSKRLALLKSMKPRMVVRKSNKHVNVQFIQMGDKGDSTIAAANTMHLKKIGFPAKCNTPSAYLTGFLAAKRASKKGVKEFVLDIGLHAASKGSLIFAALKGALDAGLATNYSEEMIPSQDRIRGEKLNSASSFDEAKKKIEAEKA